MIKVTLKGLIAHPHRHEMTKVPRREVLRPWEEQWCRADTEVNPIDLGRSP